MLASDLVIQDFPTLSPTDTIKKAGKVFLDNAIAHLAVVNSSNKIEGILPANVVLASAEEGVISDFKKGCGKMLWKGRIINKNRAVCFIKVIVIFSFI